MSEGPKHAELPPDRFTALWRRAKEHRVAQWTVGYIALAYGIQHAVILTSESFEWPNIVARGTMLAFVLGLPLVIVFAWYHGEQTTKRITRGELASRRTHLRVPVQGSEQGFDGHRPGAARHPSDRRFGPQGWQRGAHYGAA